MNPRFGVVQINDDDTFLGSGFFISSKSVLTCYHVVQRIFQNGNPNSIKIKWLGEERPICDYQIHPTSDVIRLDIEYPFAIKPHIFKWAQYTPAEGKKINIYGYNSPKLYSLECLTCFIGGYAPKFNYCILDRSAASGFSGGMACVDNLVVGVVVAVDEHRTFMIPVTALKIFSPIENESLGDLNCIVDVGTVSPVPDWGAPAVIKFSITNTGNELFKIFFNFVNYNFAKTIIRASSFSTGRHYQRIRIKGFSYL